MKGASEMSDNATILIIIGMFMLFWIIITAIEVFNERGE